MHYYNLGKIQSVYFRITNFCNFLGTGTAIILILQSASVE